MGILSPNQLGGLPSMNLHYLFTLMISLIGTLGYKEIQYIKYISEYILKLQIRQHSLLTRKVFSRQNLSTQVFFFVSSGSSSSHLCLQFIFIFRSSSSSSNLHLDLDHHSIWIIITGSGSSLDLNHHHCWIIITGAI